MLERLCACVVAVFVGVVAVGYAAIGEAQVETDTQPAERASVDPALVFEAAGRRVVLDASARTIAFDGATLAEPQGVVDAAAMGGFLLVLQDDAVLLVYALPAPETDGVATLAQRIEGLGRGTRAIAVAEEVGRAIVLAADTTELLGVRLHEPGLVADGTVDDPAFVDHARFLEYLRREDAGGGPGAVDEPRALAVGPNVLALATDRELLSLFYLDRSYRLVSRTPLPEGLRRVDAIAYTGSRWVLGGFDAQAEPALLVADAVEGPWRDLGAGALDAALAAANAEGGGGEPVAWLPGGFSVEGGRVRLAIRGERGAVASWPASSTSLDAGAVEVRWLP